MNKYIEDTLIKLRRIYSKDETVLALSNKMSLLEVENGKLKSYINELEFELIKIKHKKSLSNGGQLWFDKYKKLKQRFDELNKKKQL